MTSDTGKERGKEVSREAYTDAFKETASGGQYASSPTRRLTLPRIFASERTYKPQSSSIMVKSEGALELIKFSLISRHSRTYILQFAQ